MAKAKMTLELVVMVAFLLIHSLCYLRFGACTLLSSFYQS